MRLPGVIDQRRRRKGSQIHTRERIGAGRSSISTGRHRPITSAPDSTRRVNLQPDPGCA
jgi:hypothetical protein